jgi:predicted nucleic-acid-binding protein
MRAVDTNVLVRLVTHDDAEQLAAAEAFVESGAWVSQLTLAETLWVLESAYDRSRSQLAAAVAHLLEHDRLTLQDAAVVRAALQRFASSRGVGFSDCLVLEIARGAGHLPLGTFDTKLAKLDGADRIL